MWLALRAQSRRPAVKAVRLRIVWFSGDAFTEGAEAHTVEGAHVGVYRPGKTIADDVLDFFKRGGPGYQSGMNAVLRA